MARTIRVDKSDAQKISEARSAYTFMYEDLSAMYFSVADESAEEAAEATGGLLDMHETA